jgi:TonB family protein
VVDFDILPPQASRAGTGAVASLVVHLLVVAPYLAWHLRAETPPPTLEQMVVFLVPPNPDQVGGQPGRGVDWSSIVGNGGVTDRELPKVDRPEQALPIGTAGEPEPLEDRAPGPPRLTETALTEVEVDSVVERDPTSVAPIYPPELLAKNVEGSTFVHYVVDTTGRVDTLTIQVMRTTHAAFASSVRHALGEMKFRPAIQQSSKVRQWVQQSFAFRINRPPPPADSM